VLDLEETSKVASDVPGSSSGDLRQADDEGGWAGYQVRVMVAFDRVPTSSEAKTLVDHLVMLMARTVDLQATLKTEGLAHVRLIAKAVGAQVKVCIQGVFEEMAEGYDRRIFSNKCDLVFQHVFEHCAGPGMITVY
jgi:hypothetical protein